MCGGCLSVAYTLTGVRGNDDDVFFILWGAGGGDGMREYKK